MKRRQLPPNVLAQERDWIRQFVAMKVIPTEGARVTTAQLFDAYKAWLKKHGIGPTVLTVDGFGRLFPKQFERRTIAHPKKAGTCKGIIGIKVVA